MKKTLLVTALFLTSTIFSQSPGNFDNAFATGGIFMGNYMQEAEDITTTPGGKIIYIQTDFNANVSQIIQLNNNGTIDNAFGISGSVQLSNRCRKIKLAANGDIYAYGSGALSRIKSNGIIDNSFGSSGSINITGEDYGNSFIDIQPDGKIVICAGTSGIGVVARVNTNGTIDNTFGTNGYFYRNPNTLYYYFSCVKVQSDGKIIVAGYALLNSSSPRYPYTVRLNANGSVDYSYGIPSGTPGEFQINKDIYVNVYGFSRIHIQSDGKYLFTCSNNNTSSDFSVYRINTNGSLDLSYGGGQGYVDYDFNGNTFDDCTNSILQADGKLILSGVTSNAGGVYGIGFIRLDINGQLDLSFANNGVQTHPIPNFNNSAAYSSHLQSDGKLVLLGRTATCAAGMCVWGNIFVCRYYNHPTDTPTKINENKDIEHKLLNLYPNPTSGILNLELGNTSVLSSALNSNAKIQIVNTLGQIVKEEKIISAVQSLELNINNLEEGVYFVKLISNNNNLVTQKIIKQ